MVSEMYTQPLSEVPLGGSLKPYSEVPSGSRKSPLGGYVMVQGGQYQVVNHFPVPTGGLHLEAKLTECTSFNYLNIVKILVVSLKHFKCTKILHVHLNVEYIHTHVNVCIDV